MDKLTECRKCKGNACYEQSFTPEGSTEEITTWTCMGCGFTSSTLMTENSTIVNNLKETSPSLYVDLLHKDDEGLIWAPATITVPEKGMVFLDGSDKESWTWSAVKSVPITEQDRKDKEFPADQKVKMDMQNRKMFGQNDFMDAVDHIGFFQVVAG